MNLRTPTREQSLYFLALLLAASVRFFHLGAVPLSEGEAGWALQALQVATRQTASGSQALGPQPGYVLFTGAAFALLEATTFLARFWPALAGSLLVMVPFLFRHRLGKTAALILAFGLALDPGLVTVSRQAGGPIMALGFGLLGLGLWQAKRPVLAGLCAGAALLSGPQILAGSLALGLAWLAARFVRVPELAEDYIGNGAPESSRSLAGATALPTVAYTAGAAVLLAGTLFFYAPSGLAAWFSTLPAYLSGWFSPSGVPAAQVFLALMVYSPLALLFAILWSARLLTNPGIHNLLRTREGASQLELSPILVFWAMFALVLTLIYPARQVASLVWVLVPIWSLAALELSHHVPEEKPGWVAAAQAVLILILFALFWITMTTLGQSSPEAVGAGFRISLLAGILALVALSTLLVSLGWSWQVGRRGLVIGLLAALLVYQVSALWGAAQLRQNQPQELWSQPPAAGQVDLFRATLEELSQWQTGFPHTLTLVSMVDSASLRWALRDFPQATFASQLAPGDQPLVLITHAEEASPEATVAYRGQDFVWWVTPGWAGSLPADAFKWFTFRQAPLQQESIILWARSDIFPGGVLAPATSPE